MFEFGSGEILILLLLAFVLLGPKRLPEVARQLGRMIYEFKRVSADTQDYLQQGSRENSPEPTGRPSASSAEKHPPELPQ